MKAYNIIYSDEAILDIESIENYIIYELKNPSAAWETVDGIIGTVKKMNMSPKEHPLVNDLYLAEMGIRLTYYKNYNMLYIVEDETYSIYIVRILSNRRDWVTLLSNNNLHRIK